MTGFFRKPSRPGDAGRRRVCLGICAEEAPGSEQICGLSADPRVSGRGARLSVYGGYVNGLMRSGWRSSSRKIGRRRLAGDDMYKATEEHIDKLAGILHEHSELLETEIARLVTEGETPDFYQGFVSGLVFCQQVMMQLSDENKRVRQMIALAAASASENYLKARKGGHLFSEEIIFD
jgi:hypothetical protein